jgi:PPOX class probable F420-dependent enzyme
MPPSTSFAPSLSTRPLADAALEAIALRSMPKRRDQIRMSPEEVTLLLEEQSTLIVATIGSDGRPHVTPLGYVLRRSEPWIFTYGKSQKVRNLERDPRATLLVEAGGTYAEVRGVMLIAEAEIHRDPETVAAVAEELFRRYGGGGPKRDLALDEPTSESARARVSKRVAVQFHTLRTVSWDHSKLGGAY